MPITSSSYNEDAMRELIARVGNSVISTQGYATPISTREYISTATVENLSFAEISYELNRLQAEIDKHDRFLSWISEHDECQKESKTDQDFEMNMSIEDLLSIE